jgi:MarR family transcriptional regulator, organic hydroperoxide resistance regulator
MYLTNLQEHKMDSKKTEILSENLIKLLPLLHSTVINLNDFNTDAELGRAHYEILAFLEVVEADYTVKATMSMVSKAMNISKPYMTSLVDRLINKGFVERELDPSDRRLIRIILTKAGRAFIKEHFILMKDATVLRLSSLDSKDLEQLSSAMVIVTNILSKVDKG